MNRRNKLTIIAGPCSVDYKNISDIYEISKIEVGDSISHHKKAIFGTRMVGLKSRTSLSGDNKHFLGIDYDFYKNHGLEKSGPIISLEDKIKLPPSVEMATEIVKKTNMLIATEIVVPHLQIPFYNGFKKDKLLFWNPAVNQLGWTLHEISHHCNDADWYVGIKNGKWFGQNLKSKKVSSMEKTWLGLSTYVLNKKKLVMIHRGVENRDKGLFRNIPVHLAALRIKRLTGFPLFFDPGHACGPLLRDKITETTINAMELKLNRDQYLYDGILIEVGNSETDTDQHISIKELQYLAEKLSSFRELNSPENNII